MGDKWQRGTRAVLQATETLRGQALQAGALRSQQGTSNQRGAGLRGAAAAFDVCEARRAHPSVRGAWLRQRMAR